MTAPGRAVRTEILTDIAVLHLGQEQRTQIDSLEYPMVLQHVQKRSIAPLLRSLKIHQVPGSGDHENQGALPVSSRFCVKLNRISRDTVSTLEGCSGSYNSANHGGTSKA